MNVAKELVFDPQLMRRFDVPGPRYTSYPTADRFNFSHDARAHAARLAARTASAGPLSIYVHIPFCDTICYYCACNKIITKDHARADAYLDTLLREMAMKASLVKGSRDIAQLHLGGGTPTFLNDVVVSPDKKSVLITDMGAVTKMRGADGKLFAIDSPEHKAIPVIARVFKVTLEGKLTEVIAPTAKMLNPNGIDVLADGRIRIAEFFTGDVLEYNKGKWKTLAKGHRSGDGIVHDSKGRFYISEVMTGRVTRYEADGSAPKELGQGLKAAADHFLDEKAGVLIVPDSKAGELVFLAL